MTGLTLKERECGVEFIATPGEIRQGRRFCSGECSRTHNSKAAAKVAIERRENRDIEMKEFILEWSADNKEVVQKAPFNKITPTLKPLLEQIEEIYGVKDFRTISRSFDTTSRKVFLQKLKDYVQ